MGIWEKFHCMKTTIDWCHCEHSQDDFAADCFWYSRNNHVFVWGEIEGRKMDWKWMLFSDVGLVFPAENTLCFIFTLSHVGWGRSPAGHGTHNTDHNQKSPFPKKVCSRWGAPEYLCISASQGPATKVVSDACKVWLVWFWAAGPLR